MRERLTPIEFVDVSRGLNKFSAGQLVDQREMTDSENVRHIGAGRLKRRGGMSRFSSAGVTPNEAQAADRDGRGIVAYVRRVNNLANKRAFVESVASIKNFLYRCADGISASTIKLQNDNPTYNPAAANVPFPWKPYNTDLGTLNYENYFANVGRGFLDGKIYLGSNLTDENWTHSSGTVYRDVNYPYGVALQVFASLVFLNLGDTIKTTDQTPQATGVLAYKNDSDKTLFLHNWNGVPFQVGKTVEDDHSVSSLVTDSSEFGLPGVVLDHDLGAVTPWKGRKWGINAPTAALTATPDIGTGNVDTGTYDVKYTFIRYEGGSMSAGTNPKLSGGQLISESAPSPSQSVTQTVGSKAIRYSAWEVSPDPQVTHIRVYRQDTSGLGFYHHVCDIALNEAGNIDDALSETNLQLAFPTNDTDGYKTYGEDGEHSGFAIETFKHRVAVGGNKNYPNRVYITPNRVEHRYTEYFNTGFDITESPGETITAIKWWNETLYVFLERSVYRMTEMQIEGFGIVVGHQIVTRGVGCAARNGVLDMGDYLLVMTERGLTRFNGTVFDPQPLTLRLNDLLGTDLLNAQITRSDDYVYVITETSRAANQILTMKFSDDSMALGVDALNSDIALPEAFDFVPELTNFGNTVDDSDYLLCLFKNTNDGGNITYWHGKYDDDTENKDRLFTTADDVLKTIIVRFSPTVIDFGAFVECWLEEIIAYIVSSGDESATHKAPTGTWKVKFYINYAKDGTAMRYDEVVLKSDFERSKTLTENAGDPIQPKYTKPFDATYKHQTGGVYGAPIDPNALLADYQKILYRQGLSNESIGRIWKIIFEYKDDQNFEFNSFAFKFVREEENV